MIFRILRILRRKCHESTLSKHNTAAVRQIKQIISAGYCARFASLPMTAFSARAIVDHTACSAYYQYLQCNGAVAAA